MTTNNIKTTPCVIDTPNSPMPEVQLLSNGRYHVMVTNAGGGYSRWNNLAITRWNEDATLDNWGAFAYLSSAEIREIWSITYQPTLCKADGYEATFIEERAIFRCLNHAIETITEIAVSPKDDVEVRRIHIKNESDRHRNINLTTYAEIVLTPPATDSAHPAFNKLFIETEIVKESQAILCMRKPRAPDEPAAWMFHQIVEHEPAQGEVSYETDRLQFIGRGRTTTDPQALQNNAALSGSAGPVLDPVAAIRYSIALDPGETSIVDLIFGISDTREGCERLIEKCQDKEFADRVIAAAPTYSQTILSRLHATAADAQLYRHLAGSVIYTNAARRAHPTIIAKNLLGQSGLWAYAISGDLPVIFLKVTSSAKIELLRHLVRAHAYWRAHGLSVDFAILYDDQGIDGSAQHEQILRQIAESGGADLVDQPGGFFVRPASTVSEADNILLQTVARVVFNDGDGSLAQQLEWRCAASTLTPLSPAALGPGLESSVMANLPERDLLFQNGLGGFASDGDEYVITTTPGKMTPAPWMNILANPSFGTLISESGSANTWSENAQEYRLTPWSNDPVSDANTEAYYLRDEESGRFWSATLLPTAGSASYVTRHGFGYSVFEHSEEGIESELCVYVAIDAPVKFAVLTLRNHSGRRRRLSVTGYLEWVLGDERAKTQMHVITGIDPDSGALFARNSYNTDFAGRTAFFDVDDIDRCNLCGDRGEFLGHNGTLHNPDAMLRSRLSGAVGAALDPCAAIRVPCELADGETREIIFRLGAELTVDATRKLVLLSRGPMAAHDALNKVKQYWRHTLSAVRVKTPDRSLDILANGWLVYQTLACRMWARNAFYQSSGAFGFRDQLQDVMALIHATPTLVRKHLLLSASRQFPEGDAQHWWHPPSGRGVRTHCSDDYLWLPLSTCRYVMTTGDTGVLDEPVHFINGNVPKAGKESCYELPTLSTEVTSLYDHCVRAIERGLRFGIHGLPLMGSSDWNDGMNLVGAGGKGESVWLGFFLCAVLMQFSEVAKRRNDALFSERCLNEAARLRDAIEKTAWDGQWYLRAWFDDGSPLGSAENTECRIDSIAQSWSVLSGAGDVSRTRKAMDAVDRLLVHPESALIQLLDPPFDRSEPNPGYIAGYLKGVRENGGQYTHAAVWAAMAFAALGDAERAWKLFTMIDPVNHANSADSIAVYKTEPYVLASDVYAFAPHTGRGGWTWYSGSAGWMYRFTLESLLGLRLEMDKLYFAPCVPSDWKSFEVRYRYRETVYAITVLPIHRADGETKLTIDGVEQSGPAIHLVNDHQQHSVEARVRPLSPKEEISP